MSRENSDLFYLITKEITDTPFVKEIIRLTLEELKETDLEKLLNELIFKDPIFSMYIGDALIYTSKKTISTLPSFYMKLKKLPVELLNQLSTEMTGIKIEPRKIFIEETSKIVEKIPLVSIFSNVIKRKISRLFKREGER